MAIHNKSHFNHGLMVLNKNKKLDSIKYKSSKDFKRPTDVMIVHQIKDCLEFLKEIPDNSIQLICIDPPYNLELAGWDIYEDYIEWASKWINESYRVLSVNGSMVIFGGIQFRDVKSGDLLDLIQYVRNNTKLKLINTIIWHYKNGMSAHRYFANRHEEAIWLAKSDNYYFDLDSVRVPYSEEDLKNALKDKRLNPENIMKGKNPTNVWEIGRLNGNSKERVGHSTQKPIEIIERFVKSLSYPGAIVLDFFAGSGTIGRACINLGRNCLMCDSDNMSIEYFSKHINHMKELGQEYTYKKVEDISTFFSYFNNKEI
ncbi:MAG: site-specific DNA-methyltransferase [Treponema sp.]|nr:site-specific DNA-methyltransferase [Treponema sp.]